jgi:signal transduction histidine kinase
MEANPEAVAPKRSRRSGSAVRVRTTAAAMIVVGVSLVVAGFTIVTFLQSSLRDHVRTTALIHAKAISSNLSSQLEANSIQVGEIDEEFVQVVDSADRVIASSSNMNGQDAVARMKPGEERTIESVPFEDSAFLAVARSARGPQGEVTVIAGQSLEPVTESARAVTTILGVTMPVLLLIVGGVTWLVVGRALAPVEAIRKEVEAISSAELHRRVPQPSGRDEIARLASTMNQMLGRLEEGQLRERRFISDASHELRSPVASIRQHAEVAISHPDTSNATELAEVVLEEDLRLQRIVEDLLLLTRVDEGTFQIHKSKVDIDDLMFEEAERIGSSTTLSVDVSDVSDGTVVGDKGQLERLVRNLMDNAARHASSAIRVSVAKMDGHVVLNVDDDGPGIPSGMRSRVFERFTRLDEARDRPQGGAGLGLAIVSEIVGAHGGSVSAGEAPRGGARFEVVLPGGPPEESRSE